MQKISLPKIPNIFPALAILGLVISIVLSVTVVEPAFRRVQLLEQQVQAKKDELKNKEEFYADIHVLAERLKDHDEQLAKIDTAIPDGVDIPDVYRFIENMAKGVGLNLTKTGGFTTKAVPDNADLKETILDYQVSGPYQAFKYFLLALEKSSRMIEISEIGFGAPGDKSKAQDSFDFTLKIKFYSH